MSTDLRQLVARLDEKYNDGDFDKGDAYDIASAWPEVRASLLRNICECGHEAAEHEPFVRFGSGGYGMRCTRRTTVTRCNCNDFRPLATTAAQGEGRMSGLLRSWTHAHTYYEPMKRTKQPEGE